MADHPGSLSTMPRTNWAGNYTLRAHTFHVPASLDELQELVAGLPRVRVLGSRHSFTGIVDSDVLVATDHLPGEVTVDRAAMTVTVPAAMRYGDLATELARHDLALGNLASLPHIAVAGAVATATHGSGDGNGNLATAVAALELVTSDGELRRVARGDPGFEGMVVSLGALGAVIRVTLDVEPAYEVAQTVFDALSWMSLAEHFDAITSAGYSVSVFHRWGASTDTVWVKRRTGGPEAPLPEELFGAARAREARHPIAGLDPINATPQGGEAGAWSDRLPHFRMGFTPSSGAEIQSEFILPRQAGMAAIDALRGLSATLAPLTQVSEIRTIAADRLWLSPQYEQDSVAIHFTWHPDQAAVERALEEVETALAPFGARPHWGKLFHLEADAIAGLYPRRDDFVALVERLDARGAFRNAWLERHVLGDG